MDTALGQETAHMSTVLIGDLLKFEKVLSGWVQTDKTFVHTSQKWTIVFNVSVACSYIHQGMMTQRSTHAFKRVMVTVNNVTGGELL